MYPHRFETRIDVAASPATLFEEWDDHERLAAHMMRSSATMGGGRMHFRVDAGKGRANRLGDPACPAR